MRDFAAGLLALAAFAVGRPSTAQISERRIRRPAQSSRRRVRAGRGASKRDGACLLAAGATALLLPSPLGLAAAPVVFLAARTLLRRIPPPRSRPVPAHLVASCADLLAACLEAGAVPAAALIATGESLPEPLASVVTQAGRALAEGAAIEEALPEVGDLASIAAVFRRSSRTGSAMTEQLIAVADQLRAQDQFDRLERAHRVGVLSALPLALCLLPAFLLLAVVPAVAGLGGTLLR